MRDYINDQVTVDLYPHQLDAAEATIKNREGFCNFSEMGVGKTLSTIAAMNSLSSVSRALIVCPNTLKGVWASEFKRSIRTWKVHVLDGPSQKRQKIITEASEGSVLVTNYESLPKLITQLNYYSPDIIIIDEAHSIKNPRAKKTLALKKIRAKYRWALTGTPIVKDALDLWSLFDWVRPGHFNKSFYAFRNRYFHVYTGGGFPVLRFKKSLEGELKEKQQEYSYRILKKECLSLPDKVFQDIEVDLSPKEAKAYKEMATFMITEIQGEEISVHHALPKMNKLMQLTAGFVYGADGEILKVGNSKMKALEELLDSLSNEKVVVWAKFKQEVHEISEILKDREFYTITGDTPVEERYEVVDKFQESKNPCVVIGNIAVAGLGLTLTESSHCIYFSNSWSLAERLQSEDRLHRLGQVNKVNYYDIVAKGTIDQYIQKVVKNKATLSDRITGDDLKKIAFNA